MGYCELQVTSNFSFLRGASHPEELVAQAVVLGYPKIAITDVNTMAGIVRAHIEASNNQPYQPPLRPFRSRLEAQACR